MELLKHCIFYRFLQGVKLNKSGSYYESNHERDYDNAGFFVEISNSFNSLVCQLVIPQFQVKTDICTANPPLADCFTNEGYK